jgi:hypothetical protein
MQHSGSVRLYGGRLTLRYDLLGKEWARLLPAELERSGFHPFMAIDDWEIPYVRAGFGLADDSLLPWQMFAHMRELGGVTILDLSSHPVASPISLEPGGSAWCPVPRPLVLRPAAIDAVSRDR